MAKKLSAVVAASLAIASSVLTGASATAAVRVSTPPPPALRAVLEKGGFTWRITSQGKYGLVFMATRPGGWLRAALPFPGRSRAATTAKAMNSNPTLRAKFVSSILPGEVGRAVRIVGRVVAFRNYVLMTFRIP